MKDLIAKLQMDANVAMGAIWMHIDAREARIAELESEVSRLSASWRGDATVVDAQAERIAELEAQIAAASKPAVEQQPVAYLRFRAAQQWSGVGGHDIEHNEWLETCHAHEIGDDKMPAFPVYAAPQAADTDKLMELRARIYEMKEAAYTYGDNSKEAVCVALDGVLDEIDEVSSTALQAPVREVPGWISVDDRRPTDHTKCYLVFSSWGIRFARKHEDNWANGCFQDTNSDSDEGMLGWDSFEGPFTVTHWMEFPAAPVQPEGE